MEGNEIYKRHRPKKLKHVVGQDRAVKMLEAMLAKGKIPHAIAFIGPSGCGKTTLARILQAELGCDPWDFHQKNCAIMDEPIGEMRKIQSQLSLMPMGGKVKVWLLDEVQSLSRAKFAQQALLEMLEDTPAHVYFMLATTDYGKIIKPVQTRCTAITLGLIQDKAMKGLLESVAEKEEITLTKDLTEKIIDVAAGSARQALVLLGQVADLPENERVDAVQSADTKKDAILICRALLAKKRWEDVAKILKDVDEEPESIRRMVLSYASTVLLGGGKMMGRAYFLITCFESPFYDSGKAGLLRACYEVSASKD